VLAATKPGHADTWNAGVGAQSADKGIQALIPAGHRGHGFIELLNE